MDLQQLQQLGAIAAPGDIIRKKIKVRRPTPVPQAEWADPAIPEFDETQMVDDSLDACIRTGSPADALELLRVPDREKPYIAVLRGLVQPNGEPVFESIEQAMQLKLWLLMPLFKAITEVADLGPKALRRKTSSGASSPSQSADAASPNGSAPSAETSGPAGSSTEPDAAR